MRGIRKKTQEVFMKEKERHCPNINVNSPCDIKFSKAQLKKEGNYLSMAIQINTLDGSPIPREYHEFNTDETELLWDRIEEVISEAASFKDFETKVTLEDWQPGSIIIIVNVIKNIKSLWTKEEVERFVERFTKGIEKLKLESPLKFISLNIGNFIMCELAISSTCEDMMEMVDGFLDTFEQKLIPFSVNGAPGEFT